MERELQKVFEAIADHIAALPASFTFWFWVGFFLYIISGLVALANELDNLFRHILRLGIVIAITFAAAILIHGFGWYVAIFGAEPPSIFPWSLPIALFILSFCLLFGKIYLNNSDDPAKEIESFSKRQMV